jgi:serine/threonine protein kinase
MQCFARKVIRALGDFSDKEIANELRALDKICTKNHPNVITVLRHDKLEGSLYYIDMDLCDMNLNSYIASIPKSWPDHLAGKGRFFPAYDSSIIWAIMKDIAKGLSFIHSLGEVHRDLKPQNSSSSFILLTCR